MRSVSPFPGHVPRSLPESASRNNAAHQLREKVRDKLMLRFLLSYFHVNCSHTTVVCSCVRTALHTHTSHMEFLTLANGAMAGPLTGR